MYPNLTKKLTHTPYLSALFLPCGVGIFHCYIHLLSVFLFHRNDCSLPYLELGPLRLSGEYLLNNKNGSDGKCSQCARF